MSGKSIFHYIPTPKNTVATATSFDWLFVTKEGVFGQQFDRGVRRL